MTEKKSLEEMMEEFWVVHVLPLLNRLFGIDIEYKLPGQTNEEFKQEMMQALHDLCTEAVREKEEEWKKVFAILRDD